MVLSRFMPRNEKFGELFAASARNAQQTAEALIVLLGASGDLGPHAARLRDLEHAGDTLAAQVTQMLADSFIVPFDREDIIALNAELDDLTDFIEEAGRKLWLYRVSPTPAMRQLAEVVAKQCEVLSRGMPLIEDKKRIPELSALAREVRALEDEGDRISDAAQAALYDGVDEVRQMVQAMRTGEILSLLEDASDQAQRVAKTVENILLKNA
ncbi:DUF47 domain-containing protein [Deinococcus irradiatisoli]|uniref:DUF47 domain-containing protein n=1 Tax=Deinococcus irradiatisoli TaxID=2202254 RepID=A0A2Z3JHG3_9DEIO|nr:DUF47 family protein [Deinococcus irradiatisoli]AWN22409.1 DUF47 domain-containing protein [Deinococcus irradiatisoli]